MRVGGRSHHRTGERDLVVYDRDDPDAGREVVRLGHEDSRTLAELLGVSQVAKDLAELQAGRRGARGRPLPSDRGSPFDGRTIGDTQARTRTGVSVVAVLRAGGPHPAPGPEFPLHGGRPPGRRRDPARDRGPRASCSARAERMHGGAGVPARAGRRRAPPRRPRAPRVAVRLLADPALPPRRAWPSAAAAWSRS